MVRLYGEAPYKVVLVHGWWRFLRKSILNL